MSNSSVSDPPPPDLDAALDEGDEGAIEYDGPIPPRVTPRKPAAARPSIGLVTAFGVVGKNIELKLSPAQDSFTLGGARSPIVDITLDGDGVSRVHARLVRQGPKIRVLDQQSTNGTYFRGYRDPNFEVAPGDTFEVTQEIKLIALDEALSLMKTRLQWALGLRQYAAVDEALEAIATTAPLLLLTGPGCEHRALAEEIHGLSPYCQRDLVVAPFHFETDAERDAKLAHAVRATLYMDITQAGVLPKTLVAPLFAGDFRPIFVDANEEHAAEALGGYARRLAVLRLPPLSERAAEIPRLLDALTAQLSQQREMKPPLPIAALGEKNVAGLKDYAWPRNFVDLRRAVPRLHALLTNDCKLRAAARALGRSPSALRDALTVINVRVSDVDDDAIDGAAGAGADVAPMPPEGPPTVRAMKAER